MTRLRAPLVALAASFTVLLLGATPRAEAAIGNATLDEPPEQEATLGVPRIGISGTFTVDRGTREVNFSVKRDRPNAPSATFSIPENKFAGNGRFSAETSPDFAFNGRYLLDIIFVNHDDRSPMFGGCGENPCTKQFARSVRLEAPPADPKDVGVAYAEEERKVTVTWDDAPEPDIKGWIITRSIDGGDAGDPQSSTTPSYLDANLPDGGGKLEYFVTAVRVGGSDDAEVFSNPVSSKAVTVDPRPPDMPPPPPGASTTTTSPFGPVVTAPPTTAGKPRPRVGGNVGDFAKGLQGGPKGSTRSTLADGTYEELLPYGEPDELEPGGDDEAQQVFEESPGAAGDALSALFYVAGASLAFVTAMHVLFILRQVKRADLTDALPLAVAVPAVADVPSPESAAAAAPRRQPRVAKRVGEMAPPDAPKRTPRRVR